MKSIIYLIIITVCAILTSYLLIYKGIKDYSFHKKIDFFKDMVKIDAVQIVLGVIVVILFIASIIVYICF